jgi:hypothetical protein
MSIFDHLTPEEERIFLDNIQSYLSGWIGYPEWIIDLGEEMGA